MATSRIFSIRGITKHKAYAWTIYVAKIALLLLLFGFMTTWVLYGSPSNLINQVSIQRARSERIAKDALTLEYRTSPLERTQAISELQDTLPLWTETERGLVSGDSALGLPHHPPDEIRLLVIQAQSDYVPLQVAAQHILANPNHVDPVQVQIILSHEHGYAVTANQITLAWEQYIDDFFYRLFWIETGFVVTVATVITVNFFVIMQKGNV